MSISIAQTPDESPFGGREAEVEAALLKSLQSDPATPMTRADWDELKRRALVATSTDNTNQLSVHNLIIGERASEMQTGE